MRNILLNFRCHELLQVGAPTFMELCNTLQREGGLQPTEQVGVVEQVAKFFFIVGQNIRNCAIQAFFAQCGETVSRHFHSVLNVVIQLEGMYMRQSDGQ